ncbi:MAG: tRNA (adenosine(37)-N6)-threonylcarbamoyltransferase complex dimerization subunit type 1 TsaB [Planctomycetota bacterium]|jgi:tRNA threonylcarbamoyladenosine biosynthesis protein TsaB
MTQKPLILAVETSGRIGSVAIALGEKILGEVNFSGTMRHSSEIFPAISALLEHFGRKPKDIKHVYISAGPGSFTGLRIAVALAKTMHLTNAARIVAVDTMDVIAANAADYIKEKKPGIEKIATILDAKRSQFFIAAYRLSSDHSSNTQYEKILPDCLMTASQFLEKFADKAEPIWLLGESLIYHKDTFKTESVHFLPEKYWRPCAAKVHLLGWQMALKGKFADPLNLQPTYLRRPEAEEKWTQHKTNAKQ